MKDTNDLQGRDECRKQTANKRTTRQTGGAEGQEGESHWANTAEARWAQQEPRREDDVAGRLFEMSFSGKHSHGLTADSIFT